jgi:hypothetical protein
VCARARTHLGIAKPKKKKNVISIFDQKRQIAKNVTIYNWKEEVNLVKNHVEKYRQSMIFSSVMFLFLLKWIWKEIF